MKTFICAIIVGALFTACSTTDSTPSPSADNGDAGPEAAATKDPAKDAGADGTSDAPTGCNSVVNGATEATTSTIKSAAPTATGGTIADGTYFQKELNVYEPMGTASDPEPSGLRVTLVVAGNLMQSVQELPDGSSQTFSETFTVSGTALKRSLTCPKVGADLEAVYSVTGSTLVVYEKDPNSGLVAGSVYSKQ